MPGNYVIFDAVCSEDTKAGEHDPNIFLYRYQNGVRAESISGFSDVKRRLEHILSEKAHMTEELTRILSFDRQLLQKILDYLFTHTGEVAALDIPQQPTLYVWADVLVDEDIREKQVLGSVGVDTEDYTVEDLTAVASYLTNLLVLSPPAEMLDDAIGKCELILDAAKLTQAFQPTAELEDRINLLKKKLERLYEQRVLLEEEYADEETGSEPEAAERSIDTLPEMTTSGKLYPYSTLYLMGSEQEYTGPDMLKHISVDDPELTTMSFANLSTVIVELDTFVNDLQAGCSVIGLVETYIGSLFPKEGLTVTFKKLPGVKYKRNVENLMHEEVLLIRKRGYRVDI